MDTQSEHEKANFVVKATINSLGNDVPDICCEVFLPERITSKPIFKFRPTLEQYNKINFHENGSLKASIVGFDKSIQVDIYSPIIYFCNPSRIFHDGEFLECSFIGQPQHLRIVKHLENDINNIKTYLTLWITPNPMLKPVMIRESDYKGNVRYKRGKRCKIKITRNRKIVFDEFFREKKSDEDTFSQWFHLVGLTVTDIPAANVDAIKDKLLPAVDDLLYIVSFGSRIRTACIGWDAVDGLNLVHYYRGEFSFPTAINKASINHGLVERMFFEDFVEICYNSFLGYSDKDAMRQAMLSLVSDRNRVIEETFLSVYAGLESLVLAYRRENDIISVISNEKEWRSIRKGIRKNIFNTIKQKLLPEQRCQIYKKIDELNKIPLSVAFERFCSYYNIEILDLWPLFKTDKSIGLTDIRNRLIHGGNIPIELLSAFVLANDNLRYTLERSLIKIFGFPVEKTRLDPCHIRKDNSLEKIEKEQEAMTQYFARNSVSKEGGYL